MVGMVLLLSIFEEFNLLRDVLHIKILNLEFVLHVFLLLSQLSINGVGLTKPLTTFLSPESKHSIHLRKPSKGCR